MEKSKMIRCRYCQPSLTKLGDFNCCVDGWNDDKVKVVSEADCESCDRFNSRYIEYPLTINGIENREIDFNGLGHVCGALCEVSPCGDEYKGKSFIGFYLGHLPTQIYSSFNKSSGVLTNRTIGNPAIFVPELGKIIWGYESWWREIKSVEDFKGISQEDIESQWYVQLAKSLRTEKEDD